MEGVKTDLAKGLRELSTGSTRFSIKAKDTEENEAVHKAFKEFSKVECDDNYTQALKRLLESYEKDYKFEAVWEQCKVLEGRLSDLENKLKEPVKKEKEETEAF